MLNYSFENGLNIHEINALYSQADLAKYRGDVAELAAGLANSTMMTARDNGRLVGLIRGVSDMHTILFINELIVLPEYSEDGVDEALLTEFCEYFKQVSQIVALSGDELNKKLLVREGFTPSETTQSRCLIRPRKLLDIRY